MLNFLAKTEYLRNTRSERPDKNRGKVVNLSSAKLLFAISDIQVIRELSCPILIQKTKNIEIQLDQSESSVESWTTEVSKWSRTKTPFLR